MSDSRTVRVRTLQVGQVISMPDAGMAPSGIEAISEPIGDCRMIELFDLDTLERLTSTSVLGLDRTVQLHVVTLARQFYTNETDGLIEVRLGMRVETVEPGETVHYTGPEKPDQFTAALWSHTSQPLEIGKGYTSS